MSSSCEVIPKNVSGSAGVGNRRGAERIIRSSIAWKLLFLFHDNRFGFMCYLFCCAVIIVKCNVVNLRVVSEVKSPPRLPTDCKY